MRYNNRRKEKRNQKTSALEQSSARGKAKETFRKEGRVLEALPNTCFRIKLDNGEEILALLSGKLRFHRIKILPGDRVVVEMTPYDKERGRIVYRLK